VVNGGDFHVDSVPKEHYIIRMTIAFPQSANARVIMVARKQCRLEFADGRVCEAVARGKLFENPEAVLVTGDYVHAEEHHGKWIVERVLPRANEYVRQGLRNERQVMFANVDRVLILASLAQPKTKVTSIDRFLVAAMPSSIPQMLILTKSDLDEAEMRTTELKNLYACLGLPVFRVSNKTGEGIEQLRGFIGDGIGAFVGNSGVGKTSLLNTLIPGLERKVQEVSSWSGKGVHTTTSSLLIGLPNSTGKIIDTPGMKSFVPYGITTENVLTFFPDIRRFAHRCKFTDCRHSVEPGCKVLEAAANGKLPEIRLTSYHRLLEGLALL
jgi:ribosome biogenesis GTPase